MTSKTFEVRPVNRSLSFLVGGGLTSNLVCQRFASQNDGLKNLKGIKSMQSMKLF